MTTGPHALDPLESDNPMLPFDPVGGVRTTALLRTVRHADDRRPMINHYIRDTRVGSGQHGEVYLCYDLSNNRQEVVRCSVSIMFSIASWLTTAYNSHHAQAIKAVKRHNPRAEKWSLMRKKNLPTSPHTAVADRLGTAEHKIRKEIAIMKQCRHGNVVRLYEVIDDKLKEKIYMGKLIPFLEICQRITLLESYTHRC
jgi:[calcium/calmodulin-dependent protein kinase] kinase